MQVASATSAPSVLGEALNVAMSLQGALGAAIAELDNGKCLVKMGGGSELDLTRASTLNAKLLRAKLEMVQELGQQEGIEDVVITLSHYYHLVRLIPCSEGIPCLFIYLVLDRRQANLAIARRALADIERGLGAEAESRWLLHEALAALKGNTADSVVNPTFHVADNLNNVEYTTSSGYEADTEEDMPSFMREDAVLRMLGLASKSSGDATNRL